MVLNHTRCFLSVPGGSSPCPQPGQLDPRLSPHPRQTLQVTWLTEAQILPEGSDSPCSKASEPQVGGRGTQRNSVTGPQSPPLLTQKTPTFSQAEVRLRDCGKLHLRTLLSEVDLPSGSGQCVHRPPSWPVCGFQPFGASWLWGCQWPVRVHLHRIPGPSPQSGSDWAELGLREGESKVMAPLCSPANNDPEKTRNPPGVSAQV